MYWSGVLFCSLLWMLEQSHIIMLDYGQIQPSFSEKKRKKDANIITGGEFLRWKNWDSESSSVDWFLLWQRVSTQDEAPQAAFRYNMELIFRLLWPLGIITTYWVSFPTLGMFSCDNNHWPIAKGTSRSSFIYRLHCAPISVHSICHTAQIIMSPAK